MKYSDEQIYQTIRSVIAETLRISAEEIGRNSVLGDELGAESLDFIDIQFRLQTDFKLSFYSGSMMEKLTQIFGPDLLSRDGQLTDIGAEVLRLRMPEIEPSKIVAGFPLAGIESLYTTATWVRVVKELLDARPLCCSACGAEALTPTRPSVLRCEVCHRQLHCPTQEELLAAWAKSVSESLIHA